MNYLAIAVAVVAAFVLSTVWYVIFGRQRAELSAAAAAAASRPPPWKVLVELVRSLAELFRAAAHKLSSERMVIFADLQQARAELSLQEHQFIENNLRHRKLRSVTARYHAHRPV